MLKLIFNLGCFALIVWVVLSVLGLDRKPQTSKATETVVVSMIPEEIIGDIVVSVVENASEKVSESLDVTIQNMGTQIVEEGSRNVETEIQNASSNLSDSISVGVQDRIEDAF